MISATEMMLTRMFSMLVIAGVDQTLSHAHMNKIMMAKKPMDARM
jgi:hypothetical protein